MGKTVRAMAGHLMIIIVSSLVVSKGMAQNPAELILLESAVAKGAVCLDGSLPGYYISKGYGEGANSWVIFLEGGGWCGGGWCAQWIQNKTTFKRPNSAKLPDILSHDQINNPDFYNWNRIWVVYCDGSSFMGDVEGVDPAENITRRGMRIFNAVVEDLIAKGLGSAQNVILTGTSAGGLAVMLHCDMFRALIPDVKTVKCVSDSGFFLPGISQNIPGFDKREHQFDTLVARHDIAKFLPETCKSKMNSTMCMFPKNIVRDIKTPLFLIESGFDYYQMRNNLDDGSDTERWIQCVSTLQNCTSSYIQSMIDFRRAFLNTLQETIGNNSLSSRGLFVHSCITHTHISGVHGWNPSPIVGNKTIQQAVGDWFFERSPVYEVDTRDVMPNICP